MVGPRIVGEKERREHRDTGKEGIGTNRERYMDGTQ